MVEDLSPADVLRSAKSAVILGSGFSKDSAGFSPELENYERASLESWATDMVLNRNDVHVWYVSLDQLVSRVRWLAQRLSADELMRASRFNFELDRKRFIVGRSLLRTILGHYVGMDPAQLRFCYGSRGKPALAEAYGVGDLRFNLAHSQGLVLYAVTRGCEIGVDVEYLKRLLDAEQVAEAYFSTREKAVLRALPASEKHRAFFNCWTRKEAYLKARGDGLAHPLDEFDVSLAPGDPARLISIHENPQETNRWSLQAIDPAPEWVAALAVEGHGWRLVCRHWPGQVPGAYGAAANEGDIGG